MTELNMLKKSILMDGKIDKEEVKKIRTIIYDDGKIDREEANFLFALNTKCSGADNHSSWTTLFVQAITSYLLDDEASPGSIDKQEARWLLRKIKGDGKIDEVEKKLLKKLAKLSRSMPANLTKFIALNT